MMKLTSKKIFNKLIKSFFIFIMLISIKGQSQSLNLDTVFIDKWYTIIGTDYLNNNIIDTNKIITLKDGNYCIFHDLNKKIVAAKFRVYKGMLNGICEIFDIDGYLIFHSNYCNNKIDGFVFFYDKVIYTITLYKHGVYDGILYRINKKGKVYQTHNNKKIVFKRKMKKVTRILEQNELDYEAYKIFIGKFQIK